ncbi:Ribonuclease T2-like [Parasponia andersonii]|uniref:Ribonuclease T2-like n=1 Tax=Parasponia andersonii TaxID=3476 RepID=A0A2P5CWP6_PARAD|nr:Ribonuclease T2-like [Parasponia andersonii]
MTVQDFGLTSKGNIALVQHLIKPNGKLYLSKIVVKTIENAIVFTPKIKRSFMLKNRQLQLYEIYFCVDKTNNNLSPCKAPGF